MVAFLMMSRSDLIETQRLGRILSLQDIRKDSRPRIIADASLIAVAIALPWSTSVTAVAIGIWLAGALVVVTPKEFRGKLFTLAGGVPVLLWVLAVFGMLWSQASWAEAVQGLGAFHKLLLIHAVMAYAQKSNIALKVIVAFTVSVCALLTASWLLFWMPSLWPGVRYPGVPVKDYITQSGLIALCAFGTMVFALNTARDRLRRWQIALVVVLICAIFANIAYVATSRTTLVVCIALALLICVRFMTGRYVVGGIAVAGVVLAIGFFSSTFLQDRWNQTRAELSATNTQKALETSTGVRIRMLEQSAGAFLDAPIMGHGTGATRAVFEAGAKPDRDQHRIATSNPHSQLLSVAVQLGLVGVLALAAMWWSHIAVFLRPGFVAGLGLVLVVQHIVSCQFNSHIADFTQGWLYVFGVGILAPEAAKSSRT